jgi:hypothetical protein
MSTPRSKKRVSSFVPRIVLRGVVATVVPACAVAAGSLQACSSGSSEGYGNFAEAGGKDARSDRDDQVIVLAQVGFDAASDAPEVIALAQVGFDAAADAKDGG